MLPMLFFWTVKFPPSLIQLLVSQDGEYNWKHWELNRLLWFGLGKWLPFPLLFLWANMISYWKNPILHKFCSYRTILTLSPVSSVGNTHIGSANKGAKSFVSLPSLWHPLSSTSPIKILCCAPSLWPEYYSLLCDLESACLSPDWAAAAEQLWKQWRSWGKLWLVGEAGEIWDPPGPVPMSAHKPGECGCHRGRFSHSRPSPKLGLPITGAALAFWHPLSRKKTFSLLFPPWPQDSSINRVLLGSS